MDAESPADILRRAADLIETRAVEATPGPWGFTDACDLDDGEWYAITAAERVEVVGAGHGGGGVALDHDALWIATVHPGIAAPLAAYLRAEADHFDAMYLPPTREALALAHALLNPAEETP